MPDPKTTRSLSFGEVILAMDRRPWVWVRRRVWAEFIKVRSPDLGTTLVNQFGVQCPTSIYDVFANDWELVA